MNDKIKNKIYYLLPIVLILVSLYCVFNNYLWADETFSLIITKKTYTDMIYNLSIDMHPPVYFSILKFGSILLKPLFNGNIIYAAKFVTFLPIILLVIVGFTLVRKLYGKLVSFLFNIFIVSMPEMLVFAVEIRMYSYALLFVTVSFLYGIKALRENKKIDWVLFTIFTLLSVYTHYFSTITSMAIYFVMMLYVLFKEKKLIKRFFMSAFTIVIAFTPWLLLQITKLFSGGLIDNFWITRPTLNDIWSYVKFPFSVMRFHFVSYILIIITALIGLNLLINLFKKKDERLLYEALYAVIIVILVTFAGTVVSLFIKPIFVRRYMVPGLGCFWLGVAIAIKELVTNAKLKNILILTYILSGFVVITERLVIEYDYSKELEKMHDVLDNNLKENDVIITNKQTIQQTLTYYYPKTKMYLLGSYNLSLLYDNTFDMNYVINIKSLDEIKDINNKNYIFASSSKDFFKDFNIDINKLKVLGSYYLDNAGEVVFYRY
jgi:uncharacterized membrane protein